jgi:hypothetical protein
MYIARAGALRSTSLTALLLGVAGLAGIMLLDIFYWDTGIFLEGWPDFSAGHLLRSMVILVSQLCMVWGLSGDGQRKLALHGGDNVVVVRLCIYIVLTLSVGFVFLFLFRPSVFNSIAVEDGLVEWGSAVLLFCCALLFAVAFAKSGKNGECPRPVRWTLALFTLVFFVLAMEEVSWFQRVLDIDTPELFGRNMQHEMNLHNFDTNLMENVYYFGAFGFLVLLPLVYALSPIVKAGDYSRTFLPRPYVVIAGAVACAYNFDMWNILFIQITFFGAVITLIVFSLLSETREEKAITLFAAMLITVTQVLFLVYGENFYRIWDVTEYKELFIPLAFYIYSLSVYRHVSKACLADNPGIPLEKSPGF